MGTNNIVNMGIIGAIYHLAAIGCDIATGQHEKIDKHVEKTKRSIVKSPIDPLGILDVSDIIKDVDDDN